jgi:hypothetical protein
MLFVTMEANIPYFRDHLTPANIALALETGDHAISATEKDDDIYMSCQASELPAGALQAATTAAEKAQTPVGHDTACAMILQKGKRKKASTSPEAGEDDEFGVRRARVHATTGTRSTPHVAGASIDSGPVNQADDSAPCGTDTPGIHSAAALFRRPSDRNSRKHTRLPMSKLFMSLQLSPESFLHLQSEAKSYMLDPAYPERQNCVGNKGKGDTDMVKLRLFNCVRKFLEGGAGDRYFGEDAASERQRERDPQEAARALGEDEIHTRNDLIWPRDGNKLMSLVTPLLRRMVTNERQRVYALETRKSGSRGKESSVEAAEEAVPAMQQQNLPSPLDHPSYEVTTIRLQTPKDLNTMPFSYIMTDLSSSDHGNQPHTTDQTPHLKYLNIFLKMEKRVIGSARFSHIDEAPLFSLSWLDLLNYVVHLMGQCKGTTQDHDGMPPYRLEAMRSEGRAVIKDDSDWEALKLDVAFADWADQTLNVVAISCSASSTV